MFRLSATSSTISRCGGRAGAKESRSSEELMRVVHLKFPARTRGPGSEGVCTRFALTIFSSELGAAARFIQHERPHLGGSAFWIAPHPLFSLLRQTQHRELVGD